ncbi:MAG: hypothetical protein RTV72_01095 [Candidatus Thorarchaeota archaeon]
MQWWMFGLAITDFILIALLVIVVFFVIQGFFLGVGLGFVNGKNKDINTTFFTSLLMALVIWIPCVGCFIAWYFITSRHKVGWIDALIAWILGGIIAIITIVVLIFALGLGGIFAVIIATLIP